MKRKPLTRILLWTGGIFVCLVLVLAVHIYLVTRPHADAHTRVMARIDIKQPISPAEADNIKGWMYRQPGIDHVMVNPENNIVIFTFYPVKTNGNTIVSNFKTAFNYPAERFMPSEEEMAKGCPAMAQGFTAKLHGIISSIF